MELARRSSRPAGAGADVRFRENGDLGMQSSLPGDWFLHDCSRVSLYISRFFRDARASASDARAVVCRSQFRDFFAIFRDFRNFRVFFAFFRDFRDFLRFFAIARASLALATLALARASRIAKNTGVQND